MKLAVRALAGVAALVLVPLAACSSSGGDKAGAAKDGADVSTIAIELTNDGCVPDVDSVKAGSLTFNVTNNTATGVTEIELMSDARILGEKENLAPGFSGSFSIKLDPGSYTIYCPGAKTSRTAFTVTGTPSQSPTNSTDALDQGAQLYSNYVNTQADQLVVVVQALAAAIKSGNLDAAKAAYAVAREPYEKIEPVAESFTTGDDNLDADIDAREGDVPDAEWSGFHVIEKGLFETGSLAGMAVVADTLVTNVQKLQGLVKGLEFQPAELANGAMGLMDEVQNGKITGEEERYSHIDLVDFAANLEGAQQAFAFLEPGLKEIDPTLDAQVDEQFTDVATLLDSYKDPSALGGYQMYSTLTQADTRALSQAVAALVEPLSGVAAKVV